MNAYILLQLSLIVILVIFVFHVEDLIFVLLLGITHLT